MLHMFFTTTLLLAVSFTEMLIPNMLVCSVQWTWRRPFTSKKACWTPSPLGTALFTGGIVCCWHYWSLSSLNHGRHDRDTSERLSTAQRIWQKFHPRLQRLGLSPQQKGAVVSCTVISNNSSDINPSSAASLLLCAPNEGAPCRKISLRWLT